MRGQLLIRARALWNRRGFAASIAVRSNATRKPVALGFINRTGTTACTRAARAFVALDSSSTKQRELFRYRVCL
jgi:hypothetical protein